MPTASGFRGGGNQNKLCSFEAGILPTIPGDYVRVPTVSFAREFNGVGTRGTLLLKQGARRGKSADV